MRTNFRVYTNLTRVSGGSLLKDCLDSPLARIASCLTDGDVSRLADDINIFFHSISADLPVFNFNCVAQLLSDIDVFPEELIIEPYSI